MDERTFWYNYLAKVYALKDAILSTSVHLNSIDADARAGQESGACSPPRPGAVRAAAPAPVLSGPADELAERIRRELALEGASATPPAGPVVPAVGAPVEAPQPNAQQVAEERGRPADTNGAVTHQSNGGGGVHAAGAPSTEVTEVTEADENDMLALDDDLDEGDVNTDDDDLEKLLDMSDHDGE